MVLSLVTVGYGGSTYIQLVGVCFAALQGGLGEASFLALSSFYDTPRALTAWSSGTGFAGIFGYAWVFFFKFVLGFSFRATLMMANLITLCWLYAYFRLLSDPNVSSGNGGSRVVTSSSDQAHNGEYSPLSLQQLPSSTSLNGNEARHTSSVDREGGRGEWGGSFGAPSSPGGNLRLNEEVVETRAAQMTTGQRLRLTLSLWRFTVPLMLVYFAEVMGAFNVFGAFYRVKAMPALCAGLRVLILYFWNVRRRAVVVAFVFTALCLISSERSLSPHRKRVPPLRSIIYRNKCRSVRPAPFSLFCLCCTPWDIFSLTCTPSRHPSRHMVKHRAYPPAPPIVFSPPSPRNVCLVGEESTCSAPVC